jgi:hypothetical protein
MKSIKECLNILLLLNETYALWEKVLFKWENANLLDKPRKLPTMKVAPIGKLAFNCLVGLCKSQMAVLV